MPQTALEPGDILLFKGTSLTSLLIRFFSNSPYSHAALYCGVMHNNHLLCEAERKGVWINTLMAHKKRWPEIDVFRVKTVYEYRSKTPEGAYEHVSKPYGAFELIGFLIAYLTGLRFNPFGNADSFICSEVIDNAYFQLFSLEYGTKSLVSPADISRSNHVQRIASLN